MQVTLGVDIAKKTFDVALLRPDEKPMRRKFNNRPSGLLELAGWIGALQPSSVVLAMEATGVYGAALAQFAFDQGWTVFVLNPARVKAYATALGQGNKTDRADSLVIGCFAQRTPDLLPWTPAGPARQELRALVRERLHAQRMLQAERNRQQTAPGPVRTLLAQRVQLLEEQVQQLWKQIRQVIKRDAALQQGSQLLESIPGLGPWSAALLLSELPEINAQTSAREIAALFGVCPRIVESGSSVRGTYLKRAGRPVLRHQLFMPAMAALKHNPSMRAWAAGLTARGKAGKQIIAAAIHKLVRLAVGVLKTKTQFRTDWKGVAA
jgi:transposase